MLKNFFFLIALGLFSASFAMEWEEFPVPEYGHKEVAPEMQVMRHEAEELQNFYKQLVAIQRHAPTLNDAVNQLKTIQSMPEFKHFFNDPKQYYAIITNLHDKFGAPAEEIEKKFPQTFSAR